jgi:ATP-dependent helicase HrpB
MPPAAPAPLPVDAALPGLRAALAAGNAVLTAEPGAGKTTRVPLALLDAPWLSGRRIVMLEPRRLAARAAARRMAATLGEAVGDTVGYRVRLDSRVGPRTRIEVVTEGILTRRLQSDAELAGVGLVIFDEFHERSLDADLGLALTLDVQGALRPDLRLLAMSATLDAAPLAALLGDAAVVTAAGRSFPVETRHLPRRRDGRLADDVAAAVRRALAEQPGSVLAFLPGEGEIRRTAGRLAGALPADVDLLPLYGALPADAQDRAIRPAAPGRRKAVLATTIAETSLTIDGIGVVVDGGYRRAPRFDPATGMTRLETVRVSAAAAAQRCGRAGRLAPGICYRLWPAQEDRALVPFDPPEIVQADLAPLALDLAQWGVGDPAALRWLDAPPAAAFARARDLLRALDAIDGNGAITPAGKRMAALPLHPRLAHMVAAGAAAGHGALACDLAALLSERDLLSGARDADLRSRVELLRGDRAADAARGARDRVRALARQLRRLAGVPAQDDGTGGVGALVALAWPDRVARRRGGHGRYRLSGGGGATIAGDDPLAACDFLAVAATDGRAEARIFLAAPLTQAEIEAQFAERIATLDGIAWDARSETVAARRQRRLGALVLDDRPLDRPDADAVAAAMVAGVCAMGLDCLPWSEATRSLQARVGFLRAIFPDDGWPDLSDATLRATLEDWLAPFLAGVSRRAHLARLDLHAALSARIPPALRHRLDRLAPARLAVPSGAALRIDYAGDNAPALSVRLQEMFGLTETPRIADGRVALTIELLSPARRPLAVTRDLAGFWAGAYADVRREMRGRYPRHAWPEDPAGATPVKPNRVR